MSELIDLCQKLIQFQSVSGNVNDNMHFLKDFFEHINFKTQILTFSEKNKSIPCLYASYGSGHPHLLFVGHTDIVSAGDEKQWKNPPFTGVIENNYLYGRGICDMKGGIACFAQACKDFIINHSFNGKISIIISGDEEEPIVTGTEKVLQFLHENNEEFDFALVGEPSNPSTMGDEIKIGRRGDIVFHITSYGQSGHTAYSDFSCNPVHNLVNFLYSLQKDKLDNGNDYFSPSSLHVTTFDVGNKASNVVPQKANATIDIRFTSDHTFASIENWLNQHIKKTGGNFDVKTEYIGQSFLSSVNDYIKDLQQIIEKHTGKTPTYSTAGGTSDARFVKDFCPVVEYGLTNSTIHQINEHESLQNIEILYLVYSDFLVDFFHR